jgi:hypothetical protein
MRANDVNAVDVSAPVRVAKLAPRCRRNAWSRSAASVGRRSMSRSAQRPRKSRRSAPKVGGGQLARHRGGSGGGAVVRLGEQHGAQRLAQIVDVGGARARRRLGDWRGVAAGRRRARNRELACAAQCRRVAAEARRAVVGHEKNVIETELAEHEVGGVQRGERLDERGGDDAHRRLGEHVPAVQVRGDRGADRILLEQQHGARLATHAEIWHERGVL